jgi:hypothetical protein
MLEDGPRISHGRAAEGVQLARAEEPQAIE